MKKTPADSCIAMGTYARVTDKNSVSLGKFSSTQGTALDKDTKAAFSDETVSKDAGVVSVGTKAYTEDFVTGRIGDKEGDKYALTTEKRNIPEMKRRIVNVAGGINDNDAVNVKQLTAVADSPVYFYSGGTADSNKVSGNYNIRNIRLAFMDGLTAATVDESGNSIVKVSLSKDVMDKINSSGGTGGGGTGGGSTEPGKDTSDAKESADKAKESETNAGKSAEDAKKSADAAKESETNASKSAEEAKGSADNAKKYAEEAQKSAEAGGAGNVHGHDGATAIGKDSDVDSDNGTAIGNGATVGKNADGGTAIGQGAKVEDGATNSVALGNGSVADKANTVSVGSKGNERTITNVAPGRVEKGSTDAVNGGQLYDVAQQVGNNAREIRDLREESRKGDAMNAALAALKPVAYDPAEPTQIMAGLGAYRGEQAIALGAAHYVNGSTMINGGLAYAGDKHVMANVGVTWRIGRGSTGEYRNTSSTANVEALNDRVQALEATVEEQRKEIEKLIQMLNKR